jgi:hypothetical protein
LSSNLDAISGRMICVLVEDSAHMSVARRLTVRHKDKNGSENYILHETQGSETS